MDAKKIFLVLVSIMVGFQSIFLSALVTVSAQENIQNDPQENIQNTPQTETQNNNTTPEEQGLEEEEFISPEDMFVDPVFWHHDTDSLQDLAWLDQMGGQIRMSATDRQAVEEGRVDYRVIDYLLHLVRPREQGGGGLQFIRVGRIVRNYQTEGIGRLDKETLDSMEEGSELISAHHFGQAVDITEVGTITCKLVERRHLGGNTTRWQKPTPVKVAWQSRTGVANFPTPTGESLIGVAGAMSAEAFMGMLNNSGELSAEIDYIRGLTLGDMVSYIGMNVLLKHLGVTQIFADPLANGALHGIGAMVLLNNFPDIPVNMVGADNSTDLRAAIALARYEEMLNLPAGSFRGRGIEAILGNVGRRHLEETLRLPTGYLQNRSPREAFNSQTALAVLDFLDRENDSFNIPQGTTDLLRRGDQEVYRLAGVNVLSDALGLDEQQERSLRSAAKGEINFNAIAGLINPNTFRSTGGLISLKDMNALFFPTGDDEANLNRRLIRQGRNFLSEVINNNRSRIRVSGVPQRFINDLLNPDKILPTEEALARLGSQVLGNEAGTDGPETQEAVTEQPVGEERNGRPRPLITDEDRRAVRQGIAKTLNDHYELKGDEKITVDDVRGLGHKGNFDLINKIGAMELEKGLDLPRGRGMELIRYPDVGLSRLAEEIFTARLSRTLGLEGHSFSLEGNLTANYGMAIIADRLGIELEKVEQSPRAYDLFHSFRAKEGQGEKERREWEEKRRRTFGTNSWDTLLRLETHQNNPLQRAILGVLRRNDIALGLPIGTMAHFIVNNGETKELAEQITDRNINDLGAAKLIEELGLNQPPYELDVQEVNNILMFFRGKRHVGIDYRTGQPIEVELTERERDAQRQEIVGLVTRVVGKKWDREMGAVAGTAAGLLLNNVSFTTTLLNIGLQHIGRQYGVKIADFDDEQLKNFVYDWRYFFNEGLRGNVLSMRDLDRLAREKENLEALADSPEGLTPEQTTRLNELKNDRSLNHYNAAMRPFFLRTVQRAAGIPDEFREDARVFLKGDMVNSLALLSWSFKQDEINKHLPADYQLSYADFRSGIWVSDAEVEAYVMESYGIDIDMYAGFDAERGYYVEEIDPELREVYFRMMRQELLHQNRMMITYLAADSMLRKIDPHIPVGFTRTMRTGTEPQRAELIFRYGLSYIERELKRQDSKYPEGLLTNLILTREPERRHIYIIDAILARGISIGPFSNAFLRNLFIYSINSTADRQKFFTNPELNRMWTFFDNWLEKQLDIGELPEGLSKSIVYAAENNWSINARNKDWRIPSLNDLGRQFLIGEISKWGDKVLDLPVGTTYNVYTAVNAVINASNALSQAHAAVAVGQVSAEAGQQMLSTARNNLSSAQNGLIALVIVTALNQCPACQRFFTSVDKAIAAPPGTTNMAAGGLIYLWLTGNPMMLYMAAAMYFFGVHRVDYLCPPPPKEMYAYTDFDQETDRLDIGFTLPAGAKIEGSPRVGNEYFGKFGENPFDWDDSWENSKDRKFQNGKNSDLWMGWSRYYVGRLLDTTVEYAKTRESLEKPVQIITYRQANVEYFARYREKLFGPEEQNNPLMGMGFSQGTTNTINWLHFAFGGWL